MSTKVTYVKKKEEPYVPQGDQDLFDNAMTRAALAALSPEEKERYKDIGERMYGHMNFEDAGMLANPGAKMTEALACVEAQIRSGLHPSDLAANEKALLADAYGEKWYEKWGFVVDDLEEIVTVTKN